MSGIINGNIVRNGLSLCLDTGNRKSYPGSGATWFDLTSNKLNASGNASYISSTGVASGAGWTTPTTSILNNDAHSIFFMIRLNSSLTYPNGTTANWDKLFTHNAGGTDRSPSVWRYPNNRLLHWRYDPSNTGVDISTTNASDYFVSGTEFSLGVWYYVGVTKNGATATAYVNGRSVGSNTVSNPKTSGNTTIVINESYPADLNNMNCVHIYNRVLSASEILQNFSAIRGRFGL